MIKQQKILETEIAELEINGYQRNIDAIQEKKLELQNYRNKIRENGKFDIRILGPEIVKLLETVENESFTFGIHDVVAKGYCKGQPGWPGYESDKYYSVSGITKTSETLPESESRIRSSERVDTIFSQYQVGIDYVDYDYFEGFGRNDYVKNFAKPKGIIFHEKENARGIRSNIGYVYDFVNFLIYRKIELGKTYLSEEEYAKALTDFISYRKSELQELSLRKIYL